MTRLLAALLTAILVIAPARSSGTAGPITDADPGARHFLQGTWTERVVVQGGLEAPLLNPAILLMDGDHIYVFDYGDDAVKAFDRDGREIWATGRRGKGPGEFQNPTDMKLDARGNLWVLDMPNDRMTILGRDGKPRGSFLLCNPPRERFALLPAGAYAGLGARPGRPFAIRCDSTTVQQTRLPASRWLDTLSSMSGDVRVASSRDGRRSAMTLFYGGALLWLDGTTGHVRQIPAIEQHALPKTITYSPSANMTVTRLPPGTTIWGRDIGMDARTVYVLFRGTSTDRGRIIDSYDWETGHYMGSYLLPEQAREIARTDGGFVILTNEELPSIKELRWNPKR
jgi:DNA-binding beta-propeller fold protein YncE